MTDAALKALFSAGAVVKSSSFASLVDEFSARIRNAGGGVSVYEKHPDDEDVEGCINELFDNEGFYVLKEESFVGKSFFTQSEGSHGLTTALKINIKAGRSALVYCSSAYQEDDGEITNYPEVLLLSYSSPEIHYVIDERSDPTTQTGELEIDLLHDYDFSEVEVGDTVRIMRPVPPISEPDDIEYIESYFKTKVIYSDLEGSSNIAIATASVPLGGFVDFLKVEEYRYVASIPSIQPNVVSERPETQSQLNL